MSLLTYSIQAYFLARARRLEQTLHDPDPAQSKSLARLARNLSAGPLAKRLGFHRRMTVAEMRHLPQTSYKDIEPDLKAMREGSNPTFGGSPVVALGITSGTTSEPKRIPVTREAILAYRRYSMLMNAAYFARTRRNNLRPSDRTLLLTGRPVVSRAPNGLPEGFISGLMAANPPWLHRKRVLPSPGILSLPTWEEKMGAVVDEAKHHSVRSIGAVPALALSFAEFTIERLGIRNLREQWPHLEGCIYSGAALTPSFRERLNVAIGATPDRPASYWEVYAATEAQIGHTFDPSWPGMVFNPYENYYQFLEDGRGPAFTLGELKAGKKYAILVTAPGGMINYRLGDRVEILSEGPLTFRVCGRDEEELSLSAEKITLNQLTQAVRKAESTSSSPVPEFAIYLREGRPNRLVFAVSCEEPATDAGEFSRVLEAAIDRSLGELNPNYRELRINNLIYGAPVVEPMPTAVFRDYRLRNLDRGQFKPKMLFRAEADFRTEYGIV